MASWWQGYLQWPQRVLFFLFSVACVNEILSMLMLCPPPLHHLHHAFISSIYHNNISHQKPGHLLVAMSTRAPAGGVAPSVVTTSTRGGQTIQYLNTLPDNAELVFTEEPPRVLCSHTFRYMNININDEIGPHKIVQKVDYGGRILYCLACMWNKVYTCFWF